MKFPFVLCFALGLLLFAVAATIGGSFIFAKSNNRLDLAYEESFQVLKKKLLEAGGREIPLGATELEIESTINILRFDDFFYVQMPGANGALIYCARWRAGRASPREIAFHTPDHCWIAAGMSRKDPPTSLVFSKLPDKKQPIKGHFVNGGASAYVAFWHCYGSKVISYGKKQGIPDDFSWVADIWRYGLNQRKPQVFLRIHGSLPLDSLVSQELANTLSESLLQFTSSPNE